MQYAGAPQRYRLMIEYFGKNYCGFQVQKPLPKGPQAVANILEVIHKQHEKLINISECIH
jgi:tRNA U38,U39,U40 pseudouridine synthase TruA